MLLLHVNLVYFTVSFLTGFTMFYQISFTSRGRYGCRLYESMFLVMPLWILLEYFVNILLAYFDMLVRHACRRSTTWHATIDTHARTHATVSVVSNQCVQDVDSRLQLGLRRRSFTVAAVSTLSSPWRRQSTKPGKPDHHRQLRAVRCKYQSAVPRPPTVIFVQRPPRQFHVVVARTTWSVQWWFGRWEISRLPAVDQQHEAQSRCHGQDMARRRLKSTAHRIRSTRFQVREDGHPQGPNSVRAVSELLRSKHGTLPLHLRSSTISQDQFRIGLKSHLSCSSSPITWLYLRELLRSELTNLLT